MAEDVGIDLPPLRTDIHRPPTRTMGCGIGRRLVPFSAQPRETPYPGDQLARLAQRPVEPIDRLPVGEGDDGVYRQAQYRGREIDGQQL